ncbi:3-keto-disaccharide hydrolase [Larkinella terrae]|uniref:DUF1080 domain-containing protein n=1 Tax=Larkinella terrae TaxID=2025311 RepID=A0A7K0EJI3_9BACT|nr:DUF1080 domain-containing protein [Larkinella terrae]MRS61999.1 DUF1080 domain-containing protein [Larkinella terrae]
MTFKNIGLFLILIQLINCSGKPTHLGRAKWITLFDGKSLAGWHSYLKPDVSPKWKVEDGCIVLTEKGAGDLLTDNEYEDFELELEWKISEGGNSGIIYHVNEAPEFKTADVTGLEMQVLDNERHPNAKQGADRTAGSLFDLYAPTDSLACRPAGQWNKARIVVKQRKAEHYLNNRKIVEYALDGPEWDHRISDSKFKNWTSLGKFPRGHIALQDHGDRVWYRRIRIREF